MGGGGGGGGGGGREGHMSQGTGLRGRRNKREIINYRVHERMGRYRGQL